jgi:hypothetical protein
MNSNFVGGFSYFLKTLYLWETFSPNATRILRRVMIRDGIPFSIRSMVKGEIPARLANSILLHILASRSFLTLFLFSMGMHLRLEGHGSRASCGIRC